MNGFVIEEPTSPQVIWRGGYNSGGLLKVDRMMRSDSARPPVLCQIAWMPSGPKSCRKETAAIRQRKDQFARPFYDGRVKAEELEEQFAGAKSPPVGIQLPCVQKVTAKRPTG